jgi:hypothetical protein
MESFYALPQKKVLNRRRWRTGAELGYEVTNWDRTHTSNAGAVNGPSAN